jgi:hypothetical protein
MQIKCGFQNSKKFADDLSDSQFLKKNVALRKKKSQQITISVTQIAVT